MASQLLVLLVASCCVCVSLGESHLLTVVGEVGESSARLLLDHATTVHRPESDWLLRHLPRHLATTLTSLPVNVTISLAVASQSFLCEAHLGRLRRRGLADVGSKLAEAHGCWSRLTEASFAATTLPLAFSLEGLPPGRSILATVRTEHGVVDHALWRTFPASPPPHAGTEHKIIAVSCDRYLQDGDDDMVVRLVRDEWDRDLSVHMGDQIYADALVRAWKLVLEEHGGGARGQEALDALFRAVGADTVRLTLLETFRTLYRINWGRDAMRAFLRIGGHLMILGAAQAAAPRPRPRPRRPSSLPALGPRRRPRSRQQRRRRVDERAGVGPVRPRGRHRLPRVPAPALRSQSLRQRFDGTVHLRAEPSRPGVHRVRALRPRACRRGRASHGQPLCAHVPRRRLCLHLPRGPAVARH